MDTSKFTGRADVSLYGAPGAPRAFGRLARAAAAAGLGIAFSVTAAGAADSPARTAMNAIVGEAADAATRDAAVTASTGAVACFFIVDESFGADSPVARAEIVREMACEALVQQNERVESEREARMADDARKGIARSLGFYDAAFPTTVEILTLREALAMSSGFNDDVVAAEERSARGPFAAN